MIFIDSNVPMYLVGAPHRHKSDAQHLIERAVMARERLVSNVEVLQEILHRYTAINRRDAIQPAFDAIEAIVDEFFPVDRRDVERAKTIVYGNQISARDALHLATMARHGVTRIMSFDTAFDAYPGIERIG